MLKVGHHVSHTATSQAFLDSVAPMYAVICVGEGNSHGHSHEETMQKLLVKGVTVYAIMSSGTIVASTDGKTITFLGNPQPISEFPSKLALITVAAATILTILLYRKKLEKKGYSLKNFLTSMSSFIVLSVNHIP